MASCASCGLDAKLVCSKCKLVFYCSKDHQKQDWKSHKKVCYTFSNLCMDSTSKKIMRTMMGIGSEEKKPPSVCRGYLSPNALVLSVYDRENDHEKFKSKPYDFLFTQTSALIHESFPPLTSLSGITFRECVSKVNHIWKGRVVFARTIRPCFKTVAIILVIEDQNNDVVRLALNNFLQPFEDEQIKFPCGSHIAVLEPFMKFPKGDPNYPVILRCDNPDGVITMCKSEWLQMQGLCSAPNKKELNHTIPTLSGLKEEANIHYTNCRWKEAIQKYSEALDHPDLDSQTKSILLSNRSQTFLKWELFENAYFDASEALQIDASNIKSVLRKGHALIGLRKPQEVFLSSFCTVEMKQKFTAELKQLFKIASRHQSEMNGCYNFPDMMKEKRSGANEISHTEYVHVGLRAVTLENKGRALKATQDISKGTLIMVSRAFERALGSENDSYPQVITLNPYQTYCDTQDQRQLIRKTLDKLRAMSPVNRTPFFSLCSGETTLDSDCSVEWVNSIINISQEASKDYKHSARNNIKDVNKDKITETSESLSHYDKINAQYSSHSSHNSFSEINEDRVRKILRNNWFDSARGSEIAFKLQKIKFESDFVHQYSALPKLEDYTKHFQKDEGVGLWILASYFNHSCMPNCICEIINDMMIVHTTRTINKGEECCISYVDCQEGFTVRKAKLNNWNSGRGFDCKCLRCIPMKDETTLEFKLRTDAEEEIRNACQKAGQVARNLSSIKLAGESVMSQRRRKELIAKFEKYPTFHQGPLINLYELEIGIFRGSEKYQLALDRCKKISIIQEAIGSSPFPRIKNQLIQAGLMMQVQTERHRNINVNTAELILFLKDIRKQCEPWIPKGSEGTPLFEGLCGSYMYCFDTTTERGRKLLACAEKMIART